MAKMNELCGYVVVRKPDFAEGGLVQPNLKVAERTYRGIDRLQWEDLALAHYDGRLSGDLELIWQRLEANSDPSGVKVLSDYEDAMAVLGFSRNSSDLIAVWATELANVTGTIPSPAGMKYCGLDCLGFGEWSVLLAGVYGRPHQFEWAIERLNEYGLLTSEEDCDRVFAEYVKLSSSGIVEPLANETTAMNVRVFAPFH